MDNVCHTLAGAALGAAGLKQRSALAMGTLMIASNLPDVDVAVFLTDTLAMSFRRGWTHGVLAMAVLPALLVVVIAAWSRIRRQPRAPDVPVNIRWLLVMAYVATWLHVLMDFLNSYGVRLLMPFSNRWFYGDALYIVDPLLYAFLGGSLLLGWVRARRAQNANAAMPVARIGVAVAAIYMALMAGSNLWARAEVRAGLSRAGQEKARFMVTPVFANPFRREVIVDTGDRYEKGFLWFAPAPHFRPAGYGVATNEHAPAAQLAAQTPRVQAYLRWSRFPFFVIEATASRTRVYLNDYRYSGPSAREGWSAAVVDVQDTR
jgi:inner membrane protein